MALSINWLTKVITIPKLDLTLDSGTLYLLDTNDLRKWLKDIEDSEEGIVYLDTHRHNTEVTVAGVTYARIIEIINGYSITFEDGQYSVILSGSNNNIWDVANGILNQNQVQVIPTNSAGLIISSGAISEQDKQDIADAMWTNADAQRLVGLMQENQLIDQTAYDSNENLTSARMRLYDDDPDVGNVIATYTITATWTGDKMDTYKVELAP